MVRFLIFLVGMLATHRPGGMRTVPLGRGDPYGRAEPPEPDAEGPDDGDTWFLPPQSPPLPASGAGAPPPAASGSTHSTVIRSTILAIRLPPTPNPPARTAQRYVVALSWFAGF